MIQSLTRSLFGEAKKAVKGTEPARAARKPLPKGAAQPQVI